MLCEIILRMFSRQHLLCWPWNKNVPPDFALTAERTTVHLRFRTHLVHLQTNNSYCFYPTHEPGTTYPFWMTNERSSSSNLRKTISEPQMRIEPATSWQHVIRSDRCAKSIQQVSVHERSSIIQEISRLPHFLHISHIQFHFHYFFFSQREIQRNARPGPRGPKGYPGDTVNDIFSLLF